MLNAIRPYTMPFAMIIGGIFYPFFSSLANTTPYLIFFMLLLTFCTINIKKIRFSRLHLLLLLFQILGSLLIYFLVLPLNTILAQALFVCILSPTATSAPVITRMMKGDVESLTSFSLLSNLSVAIVAPFFFSIIGENQAVEFSTPFFNIVKRFGLLLVLPFLSAFIIQTLFPKIKSKTRTLSNTSFFLWAIALTILSGKIVLLLLEQKVENYFLEIIIFFSVMLVCLTQFFIGRKLGHRYGDATAGGQSLGQKNTILTIWMAQTYLNPIASIGGAAYVFWQNVVNSTQIWKRRKNLEN